MLWYYWKWAPVCIGFTLLTYILAPLLALFADKDGNLPTGLRIFQTFDATLDEGRKSQYGFTGSDWWVRTRWLWRNPGYTFDLIVLGIQWNAGDWTVIRNDDKVFYARSKYGFFNYETKQGWFRIKIGWKAWNNYQEGSKEFQAQSWASFGMIPFCCSISR